MATKLTWRDITSYGRSDTKRVPATWECEAGGTRLVVTRHIYYDPDTWTALADGTIAFDRVVLESKAIEDAKAEALALIQNKIRAAAKAFGMEIVAP